ncbi:glycosyltransferase [Limosilactobacillus fermentum]|uniref:glycosyltransferase n=1 Tax=Limosilactobacillus fermentum TaxID=1613 RepID=UPI0020275E0F|nr:glycosyltransferase [Limosilactobacillus fermentum]URL83311.1 glycosyltransferase [Limosilactobacillus fermentum]
MNLITSKKLFNRIKRILTYPYDMKFLFFRKKRVKRNGIVLLIHESDRLGASLLLLHTAEEMVRRNKHVYIISLQFGELNSDYSKIAPTQVIFSKFRFKQILKRLKEKYGYSKLLMITAAVGGYAHIASNLDYQIVSEIHELPPVITKLGLQNSTRDMLLYSRKVLFSTNDEKNGVLRLVNIKDSDRFIVKSQGTYYQKPSPNIVESAKGKLQSRYPQILRKKVIIGVGNTSYRKGFDIFINVAKEMPQYIFLWAGKKEKFFNLVKKNGLSSNFVYLGQLNDNQLSGVYSVASLLLLSSRKDTLPSTIFESLLFNIPVIGSRNSGGVSSVIQEGKNGLLTNEVSENDFISAINRGLLNGNYTRMKEYLIENPLNNSFCDYISFILQLYV